MEVALSNASPALEQVMVVAIEYDNTVADNYLAQFVTFSSGNKLFHWRDKRIPTRFCVWALPRTWTGASGVSLASYLAANGTGKEAAIDPLVTALFGTAGTPGPVPKLVETITAMPAVDREYWRKQMVQAVARSQYGLYAQQKQDAIDAYHRVKSGTGRPTRTARGPRSSPYSRPPDEPLQFHRWLQRNDTLQALADLFKDNTDNCAVGWLAVEMQTFTKNDVTNAMFLNDRPNGVERLRSGPASRLASYWPRGDHPRNVVQRRPLWVSRSIREHSYWIVGFGAGGSLPRQSWS